MVAAKACMMLVVGVSYLLLLLAGRSCGSQLFAKQKSTGHHAADVEGVKADLTVNVSSPRGELGSLLFGIFFEEINHAGVGGLYAEMVQNRAFGERISQLPSNISMYHSFASTANTTSGMFLRHCSFEGYVTKISGQLDDMDSSFAFTSPPGHATSSNAVSLESLNYPGHYLAVKDLKLVLRLADGTEDFAAAATFTKVPGLSDPTDTSLLSFIWKNGTQQMYMAQAPNCVGDCSGAHPGCRSVAFYTSPQPQDATYRMQQSNAVTAKKGWSPVGSAGTEVVTTQSLNDALPRSLHIHCPASVEADFSCGVANYGYWGMNVVDKTSYDLSLFYTALNGLVAPKTLQASLVSSGVSLGSCTMHLDGAQNWTRNACTISATGTADTAELQLTFDKGDLQINVISLMPANLPDGNPFRQDLLEMLKAMRPAFVRFPGGCYVEGDKLADAFRWKPSIGPIHERPGHYDLWGYWSEDGLGFYEYLVLCEVLHAAPVWVINNGISHTDEIATADIEPWVQDALDSLEFANGPEDSLWGSKRAAMGHPEPFNVNIMAIGNEDCGKANYYGNYVQFYNAIKVRYPSMRLIANCDLSTHNPPAATDIYDYHIYTNSGTFFSGVNRFDSFSRNETAKVFNSEYAITTDAGTGNLLAAVAEAAWMTGLERNSDVVMMASYAPLFVNVHDRRWKVDAIVYNVSHAYGTPSYWNQVMFSSAAQDAAYLNFFELNVTSTDRNGQKVVKRQRHRNDQGLGDAPQIAASVTMSEVDTETGRTKVFVKVANWGPEAEFNTVLAGIEQANILSATVSQMSGSDPKAENSLDNPTAMQPVSKNASVGGSTVSILLPQWSVSVLTISFTSTEAE